MLKRLFPTLAEWPLEVWLGAPLGLVFILAVIGGMLDLMFGSRVID
jgi:hypothetical protein